MRHLQKTYVLLFLLSASLYSHGQSDKSFFFDNIDNNGTLIKSAGISKESIYNYKLKKNRIVDSTIVAIINYDTMGNTMSYETFNIPLNETSKSVFFYNDSNQLIKIITTFSKNPSDTRQFQYDSYGNVVTRISYSNYYYQTEWLEYDKNGHLIRLSEKTNDGKKQLTRKYYYDSVGLLIRTEGVEKDGKIYFTEVTKYNKNSSTISVFFINDFQNRLVSVSHYNQQNQLIGEEIYSKMEPSTSTVYSYFYNADGTIAEWTASTNGVPKVRKRHYYSFY